MLPVGGKPTHNRKATSRARAAVFMLFGKEEAEAGTLRIGCKDNFQIYESYRTHPDDMDSQGA